MINQQFTQIQLHRAKLAGSNVGFPLLTFDASNECSNVRTFVYALIYPQSEVLLPE